MGHDAEQIDAWIKPDSDGYLDFMRSLVGSRFPEENISNAGNSELIDFMSFASFGVPRALLNMLQELTVGEDDDNLKLRLTRADTLKAVKQHFTGTKKLFTSLSEKLPVYKSFISTGEAILVNSFKLIKAYNKDKTTYQQSVSIAIQEDDISHELKKFFHFSNTQDFA